MAELATHEQVLTDQPDPDVEAVISIADLANDVATRAEAARFIMQVGSVAVRGWEHSDPDQIDRINSLHHGLKAAARGSETAREMVKANVRTEAIEQTLKAGHVITVGLKVDDSGDIYQHGQLMSSIQANSLLFASDNPKMRQRSKAEATNYFRLKESCSQGDLEDNYFVVFSPAADDMTEKEMDDANFFTDTMTMTVQVIGFKNGQLTLESAFIAGVKEPGSERHDIRALRLLARKFNQNFDDKSVTEILNSPWLINKNQMPNGVVDIVERLDSCIDQVTGSDDTFFGQPKGKQNYTEFLIQCKVREAQFEPKIEAATEELIAEAYLISTPVEAIKRLHKVTEGHMVEHAILDASIDPLVFGSPAAPHIEMARWHMENGNTDQAKAEVAIAKKVADSRSCPSGLLSDSEAKSKDNKSNDSEDCEFVSKECPICHAKNVKTTVSKKKDGRKVIRGKCGCSKIA